MNRPRLIFKCTIFTACFAPAAIWLAWDYARAVRLVDGPMVQLVRTDGCTLTWRHHPHADAVVVVDAADQTAPLTFQSSRQDQRYIAVTSQLQPGQQYRYRVTVDGGELSTGVFRTTPNAPAPFRILAFGDSGDGRRWQRRLAAQMTRFKPDLILHTGDLVYSDGEASKYPKHFSRPYAALLKTAPFYPCLGNHDIRSDDGQPMLDHFLLPENGPDGIPPERHYWFDYADTRIIAIDSNATPGELNQHIAPWLDRVLSESTRQRSIVFCHEPLFTSSRYPPTERLRRTLVPVLEKHNVDLVLQGHNHLYERSHPIRDGEPTRDGKGTIYVTTGAGGARLYEARSNRPPEIAAQYDAGHSFTLIDVAGDHLSIKQIDRQGNIVDEYQRAEQSPTPTSRRPQPAQLVVSNGASPQE